MTLGYFRSKSLTYAQLGDLPHPGWLIEGVLPRSGLGLIYGPPGSFKSFVALDWALSVASGLPWAGRTTDPVPVLYVAAEGAYGLAKRVDSWVAAVPTRVDLVESVGIDKITVFPEPVNLLDDKGVASLSAFVNDKGFRLVIFDTLARCFVGGDENSSKDTGKAVANAAHLCGLGAAVLLVHHAVKTGGSYRGSSALEGAADVVVSVAAGERIVELACPKMKDFSPFEPIRLRSVVIGASLAFQSANDDVADSTDLTGLESRVLLALADSLADTDASVSQLADELQEPQRSVRRAVKLLSDKDLLQNTGTRKIPRYRLGSAPPVPSRPAGQQSANPNGRLGQPVGQTPPPLGGVADWPTDQPVAVNGRAQTDAG